MSTRKIRAVDVSIGEAAETQAVRLLRAAAPWAGWLIASPVAATGFEWLGRLTHQSGSVSLALAGTGTVVSWFCYRMTHSRGLRRLQDAFTALAPFAWTAVVAGSGWTGHRSLPLIAWAVGGAGLCVAWNITHSPHEAAGAVDVLPGDAKPKAVDTGYVIRALTGHAPVIRSAAERAGKVVPALVSPWRDGAAPAVMSAPPLAITAGGGDSVDPASQARAEKAAANLARNFRDFTATKATDLNGARIRVIDAKPWRIQTEIRLVRGAMIPKQVEGYREHLASQNGLPLSSVVIRPNRRDHSRVFADFVLEDVLADVRHWPGPQAAGRSIADAPVRYGIYEDRVYAESWETAVTPEMAARLGIGERNLSHIISEGMTGSGKSTVVRIVITDGATRVDVEDWAIDTVKKYQTLGCVAGALAWFATDVAEAKAMVRFLAQQVIPARANYLGMHGYDNWEPGCGLPLLRVTVEEGGIIAAELDHLDAVLNSARSAGVKIRAAFQRAQHHIVDTNIRAAFGESLSFGAKDSGDVFVLPDELRDAGADPSLWSDKQPGMHYRSASGLDLQRQLMPVRSFQVDPGYCRDTVSAYGPVRDEWIAGNCPDWLDLLHELDGSGIYAARTTGADVLRQIGAAEERKAVRAARRTPDPDDDPAAAAPVPRQAARLAEEDEVFMGEIVDDEEDVPVTMDELGLDDPDLTAGISEDDGLDPRAPLPPAPSGEEPLDFGRPPRLEMPRDEAVARLRDIVCALGQGAEFFPRDLYEEACEATGRRSSWVRGELGTTLTAEGLVVTDGSGVYTVTGKAARAGAAA